MREKVKRDGVRGTALRKESRRRESSKAREKVVLLWLVRRNIRNADTIDNIETRQGTEETQQGRKKRQHKHA